MNKRLTPEILEANMIQTGIGVITCITMNRKENKGCAFFINYCAENRKVLKDVNDEWEMDIPFRELIRPLEWAKEVYGDFYMGGFLAGFDDIWDSHTLGDDNHKWYNDRERQGLEDGIACRNWALNNETTENNEVKEKPECQNV